MGALLNKTLAAILDLCWDRRPDFIPNFSMGLYTNSQVPTPSASAWRVDMGGYGGPCFVVMRTNSAEACEAVVEHLIEIGFGVKRAKIEEVLAKATITEVAVIW